MSDMNFLQNRRHFLKGMGAVGLVASSPLLTACNKVATGFGKNQADATHCMANLQYEFFGEHQSGIITPVQRHIYFLVADLHSQDVDKIRQMLQAWTQAAARLMQGKNIADYGTSQQTPPTDTGEADGLGAYGLTLTFGISPSFLQKLGLVHKAPLAFRELPSFAREQILPELSGGDICIQACAEDPQVAFHAVRQLVRQARDKITMRWSQAGFNSFDKGSDTPRNLFGFKDGTANRSVLQNADEQIWVNDGSWLTGGSYLVTRIIQMHLETWDRTALKAQEQTFARHRNTGAPLGSAQEFDEFNPDATDDNGEAIMPDIGHTTLANRTKLQMLRRSYSYSSGIDARTGQFDAGLLFISFQKSPEQFIAIQNALGRIDKMNEYTTHIGSGLFAVFGGVSSGEYLGQKLFDS
ncbi:deferrochelatase/peroxidase EfeB [Moraxella cuniculi DSM 21768]|uniref:Deferrochelatase n=1 Tax=Moraxella cuniculi DSM 21768 TaxID=1122245 RepID=A0A1N7DUX0_9GAMM|nr:iron uptake transporter deferrochelatase/peroxidase subunit [Moraxella cuniculi]SIR79620.1 deferrochelatase/peroxidase EfeB [Moraxella cuniculi DSM 21768]